MAGGPQYPQSGYGSYYGQQQYGVGQYAYPKKKVPWIPIGIISVLAIVLIVFVYLIFFSGPSAPALLVSPSSINIQVSPGDGKATTISNVFGSAIINGHPPENPFDIGIAMCIK